MKFLHWFVQEVMHVITWRKTVWLMKCACPYMKFLRQNYSRGKQESADEILVLHTTGYSTTFPKLFLVWSWTFLSKWINIHNWEDSLAWQMHWNFHSQKHTHTLFYKLSYINKAIYKYMCVSEQSNPFMHTYIHTYICVCWCVYLYICIYIGVCTKGKGQSMPLSPGRW